MNNQSKNNRSTTRPSFKQSRRGRAYYSAQSKRANQARSMRVQESKQQQSQLQQQQGSEQGNAEQVDFFAADAGSQGVFEVAKRHRVRWEIWFVLAIILLLALILGCGGMIAAKRSQDALTIPTASITKTTPASSALSSDTSESNDADADAENAGNAEPSEQPETGDAALTGRDAALAVDPANTEWNAVDDGRKVVYLTFDDGPSTNTQWVLDILDQYGCKATFFTVGHNEGYFPLIADAYKRGHTIGMHTYSHDYEQVYASDEAYFEDLARISQVVQDQIGFVPAFIRFPGGSSNSISVRYNEGIMSRLVDEVRARGYQYFDWDISFGDGDEHTADEIVEYACEYPTQNKIVILAHDSATKATTVEALPRIIEYYQGLGYSFEAIDRNTVPMHHEVMN